MPFHVLQTLWEIWVCFFINLMSDGKVDNLEGCSMCFLLNMYNFIVKNKGNYSLCGDNLYSLKCTTVSKIITK